MRNRLADVRWGVVATLKISPKPRDFGLMAMSVAAHTSASRVWSVGHENALTVAARKNAAWLKRRVRDLSLKHPSGEI